MPFPTDPRLASYFLPGYPAAIAAAMAAVNAASCSTNQTSPSSAQAATPSFACPDTMRTASWSNCGINTSSVSGMLSSSCSCPFTSSCSVSCFWAGLPGQSSSAGSSSGSSSSGYASSEGSLSNGVNGPPPGWFHSAVSPGSLMNLSHYYSYSGGPQFSRSVSAAAAVAAVAAASASSATNSHARSSVGPYPDPTITHPNIANPFITSNLESVGSKGTRPMSSFSSAYGGSLKDSMTLVSLLEAKVWDLNGLLISSLNNELVDITSLLLTIWFTTLSLLLMSSVLYVCSCFNFLPHAAL
ncbi:hypothetical protein FBUS_09060 [Fasciolopsis buskii]|uniref:Uncharacterized protein n=1 Tax=Fasciolopsis buskii TaxID=27845 RepID=A0A8E0VGJ3_9TREM|nr:hypothetical protein FBUS_09060 [Fasciolopsis buski]